MSVFRENPFNSELGIPFYQQLYTHLQTAILIGDLKPGTRLPSTRALAIQLNVSRNTVLNAYQQLIAEGYLDGMVGNGTFVARILPDHLLTSPQLKDRVQTLLAEPDEPRFSEQATLQLTAPRMPMAMPNPSRVSPRPFRRKIRSCCASKIVQHSSRRSHGSRTCQVKILQWILARAPGGPFWNMTCGMESICWSIPW